MARRPISELRERILVPVLDSLAHVSDPPEELTVRLIKVWVSVSK